MFTKEDIDEVYKKAIEKQWPYPYLFNSLKALGIERYETNVLTHDIKYVGEGTSFTVPAPEGFKPLTAAKEFNLDGLKLALERVQKRETNYVQFLSEIAASGVSFYRVDMRPRKITYHGPTPRDKHVESVPET